MPGRARDLVRYVVAMEQSRLNALNDSYRVALAHKKIGGGQRSG